MQQFIDNLISRLEERKKEWTAKGIEFSFAGGTTIVDEMAFGTGSGLYEAIGIVNQLAEEYKGGWIPCSERLPEEPEENPELDYKPLELYLVSIPGVKYPFRAFWNGKFFTDGWDKVDAIAWMPLPAPYQKEGE